MAARKKTRNRNAKLAFDALSIEGGLISPEWLSRVAQLNAGIQSEADYRIPKGLSIRDEIGRFWRIAQAHWRDFAAGRAANADEQALTQKLVESLLRDCFGFSSLSQVEPVVIAERSYPIGLAALEGRVPVVITAADKGLDALSSTLGDSGRKRSGFGLAQEFLNASEDAMWGMASDGISIRILRDNASLTRPAWIEADIQRIFSEERYADFAAFWLLVHETRFGREGSPSSDCALETWRSAGREEGTRAREHLRRGVEDALVALGQGFIGHIENNEVRAKLQSGELTTKAYFSQLLRLVYRLIFLLTVEERGLLHPKDADESARSLYEQGYSLRRLRDRSVKRSAHDRFSDLWEGAKVVFKGLTDSEQRLGLPALAGLFAKEMCSALDSAKLENQALLHAVFKLAWLREDSGLARVNWRDMGPEELGSVYESLLELVPQVSVERRQFTFATGGETKGNARKSSGSYYTPDSLVQVLLDSALDPVIADTIARNPENPVEALLDLSIVDPACGSGHFLLAAARRLAAQVARLQADGTPSAAEYRAALRQVVGRCIYGVDLNPMAVELCKVSLWMEAVDPGLPLTFLDSHIQHGNALLGTTPELMAKGIPEDAWNPIEGDDKKTASALKKRNKAAATGQGSFDTLFAAASDPTAAIIERAMAALEAASDTSPEALAQKETKWSEVLRSEEYQHRKFVADAWCAAFVWPKQPGELATAAPTVDVWQQIRDGRGRALGSTATTVSDLVEQYRFFHWHLQFPRVFARGGFDVILGNPPWEQVLLNEEEWFAERVPEIAAASNSAARVALIDALGPEFSTLKEQFIKAIRSIEGEAAFVRKSGAYPLTGKGRINTYSLFQEKFEQLVHPDGAAGIVLQTGALTDVTQAGVTAVLVKSSRLDAAFDFENGAREPNGRWFPSVHPQMHFVLVSFVGRNKKAKYLRFAANCVNTTGIARQHFRISAELVARMSPNTQTLVLFQSEREIAIAESLLKSGVFLGADNGDSVGISFAQPFNASSDSDQFRMTEDLGIENNGPHSILVCNNGEAWWPLLEAKCGEQFNHRYGSFEGADRATRVRKNAGAPLVDEQSLANPETKSVPRYWVSEANAKAAGAQGPTSWQLLYRFSAYPDNERTMIAWFAPHFPSTHITPRILIPTGEDCRDKVERYSLFAAGLNSFAFDFLLRRRMSRQGVDFFIVKQTLVPRDERYDVVRVPRRLIEQMVLELSYTAWDLQPFAKDIGYDGPPFQWDAERRFSLRCELDAAFFHLYGLSRDDTQYVMETFSVVRKNDEKAHGEYRTKRVILEIYDEIAAAARSGSPYKTRLDPPPADSRLAHPDTRRRPT